MSCSRVVVNLVAPTEFKYPDNCLLNLGHQDGAATFRSTLLMMRSGEFAGIRLRGNVNDDDTFSLMGTCGSGNEIDAYLKTCTIDLGWRDGTNHNGSTVATPSVFSEGGFTSMVTIDTAGDVNGDDSFYYRLKCPNGSNLELNTYMKSKFILCMGHTDSYLASPQRVSCKKIQNPTSDS